MLKHPAKLSLRLVSVTTTTECAGVLRTETEEREGFEQLNWNHSLQGIERKTDVLDIETQSLCRPGSHESS